MDKGKLIKLDIFISILHFRILVLYNSVFKLHFRILTLYNRILKLLTPILNLHNPILILYIRI